MAHQIIRKSPRFLSSILDSINDHIAVLDDSGYILYTNSSWTEFGRDNGMPRGFRWAGVNYLKICEQGAVGAGANDGMGHKAARGIRDVIASGKPEFHLEYPCHSAHEKRWFMMNVTRFQHGRASFIVVAHHNITKRKLAEARVIKLSRVDELTRIPNRRSFDEFISKEWRRCSRAGSYMSLAMIDIDHFKQLNDSYGHQYGDLCLKKVSRVLAQHSRRPGDHCARYGGEEFALILGNTDLGPARRIVQNVRRSISSLKLPQTGGGELPSVTVSVGLLSAQANYHTKASQIIEQADALLYQAKENGRDQVYCGTA